ncbi:DNA polymerase IV [Planctomycetes bacterium K23_9]|uniref:DNA polymerase IV n=2 Tax=Stieleria marina TaxID=1930275 RepID=A0A517NVZ0_9BACT|nr:DNA polymerase IV [Planctomycetes bacterium K23_9]
MPIAQANELANELARGEMARGEMARGEMARGEMARGEMARSRSGSATQLQVYEHDPHLDDESLQRVANLIQANLCPMVAVEELGKHAWAGRPLHQADSLICEVSGVTHLFDGEAGLLDAAEKLFASVSLVARMSIAPTVGAAWAMAHYARPIQTIVPVDDVVAAVSRLSIKALRILPQTVATLDRLGVQSMAQLLSLPRSGLATRLGQPLVQRIEQLLGEVDEPCNAHRAVAEHTQSLELEYPTTDQRILADRIERLTEKIKDGLAASHRGALRMACYLTLSDHPPLILEIGMFAPTADREQLIGLLVGRLESCRLKSDVKQITLSVTLSDRLQSAQPSLFQSDSLFRLGNGVGSPSAAGGSSLPRLINSLSGRLGRDAVQQVLPTENPLPEKAFRLAPLTGQAKRKRKSTGKSTSKNTSPSKQASRHFRGHSVSLIHPMRSDALRRPLTLLDSPMPLTAVGVSSVSSLPAGFHLGGRLHRVVRFWGPERIETGWWNGPSIRRDYYRVEMDSGGWWWIYRRLGKTIATADARRSAAPHPSCVRTVVAWMLHGRFS